MAQTPLIAAPGQIGKLTLKNRLMLAPMGTNFGTTDGYSTDRDRQYYVERAKGGVAMVMTEAMVVTEGARNHRNSLCVFHDRYIPGLARLVEAVKAHDCLVFGQISHRGGLLRRDVMNMEPVGPSAWRNPNTGDDVRALGLDEITAIQRDFEAAAIRMHRAGYDGLELHGANGYLFHQFFTPRVNRRSDHYGGSVENRARMLLETVRRIRDRLPDFALLVRVSATEYIPDGYSTEDVVALCQMLEAEGCSAIDLSGGTNESPELSRFCIQPPSMPRRCLEDHARPITAALKIPTILAGRIIAPEDAEAVLANGSADFISLGRALFADPYWPQKAFEQVATPIRHCISCNVCFERLTLELDVNCVQNPMLGTEFEALELSEPELNAIAKPANAKRVLVIGAGVAGVEAARYLAARGHDVEIWESCEAPGGQVPLALAAPDKDELSPLWEMRLDSMHALGARLKTSTRANVEVIRAYAPDHVVVATGSRPRPLPESGGTPRENTLAAWDVLARPELVPAGSAVTIIGGGMVGIEVADLLITTGCKVTIVELTPRIAPAMARNNRTDILVRLRAAGVRILLGCRLEQVCQDSLHLTGPDGPLTIPRDALFINAIGPVSNRDLVAGLERSGLTYTVIGDALRPGDFLAAIRDGWMTGLTL